MNVKIRLPIKWAWHAKQAVYFCKIENSSIFEFSDFVVIKGTICEERAYYFMGECKTMLLHDAIYSFFARLERGDDPKLCKMGSGIIFDRSRIWRNYYL